MSAVIFNGGKCGVFDIPPEDVGYQALETTSSGNVTLAPTFLKVSESNAVTLADLKVTGYTPPEWKQSGKAWMNVGGCTGAAFVMQTLTASGLKDQAYYWLDYTASGLLLLLGVAGLALRRRRA